MFRSSLAILILSVLSPACSPTKLRGSSASGETGNPTGTADGTVSQPAPAPLPLHDCRSMDPFKVCGLATLAANLETIASLGSAQTLNGIRFSSQKLHQQNLQDLTLNASCLSENSFIDNQWERSVFQGSEMIITELSRSSWKQARFIESDLRLSHFAYANLVEVNVQKSCLASINWSASSFQDVTIEDSSAEQGNFSALISTGRFAFIRGRLFDANFSRALFEGPVDFQDSDLRGVDFSGVVFKDTVNWQGAQLSGATWMDGRVCAQGSVGQCN